MKLTYRDKIFLAIISAIVILVGSYFLLIKKKNQEIKDNQTKLEDLNKKKEDIDQKIDMIPGLQKKIEEVYEETNQLTTIFVDKDKIGNPVDLDKYMRHFADDNKVKVVKLEVGAPEVDNMEYYYFEMKDSEQALRQAADLNGKLESDYKLQSAENDALSVRNVESILRTKYALKVNGTKQDIWNYLKAIKDNDKAISIDSVKILDYTFGKEAAEDAGIDISAQAQALEEARAAAADGEEGMTDEEIQAALDAITASISTNGSEITNTSDVEIVISLYSVYNMSEPDVDYIPTEAEAKAKANTKSKKR